MFCVLCFVLCLSVRDVAGAARGGEEQLHLRRSMIVATGLLASSRSPLALCHAVSNAGKRPVIAVMRAEHPWPDLSSATCGLPLRRKHSSLFVSLVAMEARVARSKTGYVSSVSSMGSDREG